MKQIRYYEVRVIADCEGRTSKVIANFTNEPAASAFVLNDQGRDMYGACGSINEINLRLYETAEEAGASSLETLRKSAAAKLTNAERIALGLA